MSGLTYLITGANRGIGYGLVEALLKRPNTTVIGTVRNPSSSSSAFSKLRPASGSRLVVVKIDSEVPGNAKTAVAEVQSQHNISKLDIVIANAGIAEHYAPAATTSLEQMSRHYAINVIAPVALFQAVLPLLQKSSNPKFVGISTGAASLKAIGDIPLMTTAYGSSKASLNFVLRKMHFEHENIIIYPINPGYVTLPFHRMLYRAMTD